MVLDDFAEFLLCCSFHHCEWVVALSRYGFPKRRGGIVEQDLYVCQRHTQLGAPYSELGVGQREIVNQHRVALHLRKKGAKVRQGAFKRKVDTCFTQLLRKPVNWLRGT